jgi:hypothetical protein
VLRAPSILAVSGTQPPPPAGATDLKFRDFFKLPVGPKGLEATEKLLSLNDKRVRLIGYMAQQELPTPGVFVFSPVPVSLGDEDESLADDLPASVVFVHLQGSGDKPIPFVPGLIKLTGTLRVGAFEEIDGHVAQVRLMLDPPLTKTFLKLGNKRQASK